MGYKIRFHGVACFSVVCDGHTLVFDPHNGISMDLPVPQIKNADTVLCTHRHYDHNNGIDLVKSQNAFVLEEQAGDFEYQGIRIHGTSVRHGGDPQWGSTIIYSVRFASGIVIIHGGDMGYPPNDNELAQILSLGLPDIVMLPIGGFYCLDARQALETISLVQPKKASILCHYLYGPLLTREDFQGMTTEAPFLDLKGSETQILRGEFDSEKSYKRYLIFSSIS
jgi:L-ascorbate metabolism protein UlaG (beta-lactamase superfamily)